MKSTQLDSRAFAGGYIIIISALCGKEEHFRKSKEDFF